MTNKTYHVFSADGSRWFVKKPGTKSVIYPTEGEAAKAAAQMAKGEREAQVVTLKPDGKFIVKEVRGLPTVQNPPKKNSLGTVRISKAISAALKKRLEIA